MNHIKTLFEIGSFGGVVDKNINTLNEFKKKFPNCSTF